MIYIKKQIYNYPNFRSILLRWTDKEYLSTSTFLWIIRRCENSWNASLSQMNEGFHLVIESNEGENSFDLMEPNLIWAGRWKDMFLESFGKNLTVG